MRFHTNANLATFRDGDRGDGFDCIPPTRYRRPRFVFSPSDPETSAALRQKIESKMKTAGILGDFLTGLFTFAAKDIGAALFDHHRTYAAGHRDCSVLHHAVLLRPTPDANEVLEVQAAEGQLPPGPSRCPAAGIRRLGAL